MLIQPWKQTIIKIVHLAFKTRRKYQIENNYNTLQSEPINKITLYYFNKHTYTHAKCKNCKLHIAKKYAIV